MSYNVNLQHFVFRTFNSESTIPELHKRLLLGYIVTISNSMNVKILRINAYLNHVHMLVDFPVDIMIPDYIRFIKSNSSKAFKGHEKFPLFRGWAKKYASFSVSRFDKDKVVNYIKQQTEHHQKKSFKEEMIEIFGEEIISQNPYFREDWGI